MFGRCDFAVDQSVSEALVNHTGRHNRNVFDANRRALTCKRKALSKWRVTPAGVAHVTGMDARAATLWQTLRQVEAPVS